MLSHVHPIRSFNSSSQVQRGSVCDLEGVVVNYSCAEQLCLENKSRAVGLCVIGSREPHSCMDTAHWASGSINLSKKQCDLYSKSYGTFLLTSNKIRVHWYRDNSEDSSYRLSLCNVTHQPTERWRSVWSSPALWGEGMVQSTRTRLFLTEEELLQLQFHFCTCDSTFKHTSETQTAREYMTFSSPGSKRNTVVRAAVWPTLFAFLLVPQQQQLLLQPMFLLLFVSLLLQFPLLLHLLLTLRCQQLLLLLTHEHKHFTRWKTNWEPDELYLRCFCPACNPV